MSVPSASLGQQAISNPPHSPLINQRQSKAVRPPAQQTDSVMLSSQNTNAPKKAKEVAKAEAESKKKSLIDWGKMAVKYTFKTAFQIVKNAITMEHIQWASQQLKEGLINISNRMQDIGNLIPNYLEHGWEFAKEHILPLMHHLTVPLTQLMRYVGEHILEHGITFGSSARKSMHNPFVTFKGNIQSSSKGPNSSSKKDVSETRQNSENPPITLPDTQEQALELSLMTAADNFEASADKIGDTVSQRETNALRYGAEVFSSTFKVMLESNPQLSQTVLNDVNKMVNEISAISLETAQKESFSDLRPATKDRMIDLVQFALKHPEPLIHQTGVEMATALGISKTTIEALQHG